MEEKKSIGIPEKKRHSVISWVGLGISAVALLIIWVAIIFAYGNDEIMLISLLLVLGFPICLAGLVCSIIGLAKAIKNDTPQWIGVSGTVASCLGFVSIFLPIVITVANLYRPAPLFDSPEVVASEVSQEPVFDLANNNEVVICLLPLDSIKCYDNRKESDTNPAIMHASGKDLENEISSWMSLKGIDSDTPIVIASDSEAKYSGIAAILDILQALNVKNYRLVNLDDADTDTDTIVQ